MQNTKLYVSRALSITLFYFLSAKALAQTADAGDYIVKFKVPQVTQQQASKLGVSVSALAHKLASDKGDKVLSKFAHIRVKSKIQKAAMTRVNIQSQEELEQLQADSDVEYVEPNFKLFLDPREGYQKREMGNPTASSFQTAADAQYEEMGVAAQAGDSYAQTSINTQVVESWGIQTAASSTRSTKIIVAVIDSGVDTEHFVFKDSNGLFQNTSEINGQAGVDDDGNGYVDDFYGWNFISGSNVVYDDNDHGTHVAGIILGAGQDIMKVPVRESKIQIMPLKFLDANGSGSTSNAISAIYYAVNNGAKVINNSWGGTSYSRALQDAYKYAYDHDVVIVTAAGNSNYNLDSTPVYPAALDAPSNIAVAASTLDGNSQVSKASFSNYSSSLVHVFAPGYSIRSTVPGKYSAPNWAGGTETNYCDNASNFVSSFCYYRLSGTSMAAPFVAGVAALLRRENSNLSAYETKQIILNTVDAYSNLTNYVSSNGQINAYKATQSSENYVRSLASYAPAYNPSYKAEATTSSDSGSGKAAGCGLVKMIDADYNNMRGGGGGSLGLVLFGMMCLPLAYLVYLRKKHHKLAQSGISRRKFDRYQINQEMVFKVGDQVITGATQTISVGGLSFKSDQNFEKGQKVKIKLSEELGEVEGEIVWSSQTHSFGVKFNEISEAIKSHVQSLVVGLQPC